LVEGFAELTNESATGLKVKVVASAGIAIRTAVTAAARIAASRLDLIGVRSEVPPLSDARVEFTSTASIGVVAVL
jgi:hypothetical protein